ncbi:MAG: metallophosphoesterase [Firmicutes bacterium]|nr:metallophosphoesterase [Bacillota bacterium]
MKVLVIPDVHLKPWMFEKAAGAMRAGAADKAVCLMDLPDEWNRGFDLELYEATFDAAIAFAKEFPDTLWCWGNHDLSYVWSLPETGYSWFAQNTVSRKLAELQMSLRDQSQLAYVHRIDDVLFLHGGLTLHFVKTHVPAEEIDDVDAVLARVNALGCEDMWNDDSPIWFRPQYDGAARTYKSAELLQVVGHTPVEEIERLRNVISCDVFSTYRDGRPVGTQAFPVIDTLTGEIGAVETV